MGETSTLAHLNVNTSNTSEGGEGLIGVQRHTCIHIEEQCAMLDSVAFKTGNAKLTPRSDLTEP